jgi:hypothetical protein
MMERYGPLPFTLGAVLAIAAFAWLNSLFWQLVI